MPERAALNAIAPVVRAAGFSALQKNTEAFAARVVALLPALEGRRVLEIGSGSGETALYIRKARPLAQVTGIDFSAENVAVAQARGGGSGVAYVCADYLDWQGGRFDLIAADSVLHLIDAPFPCLAAKLATDLAPGGIVVATVPDAGMLNRAHLVLRRLWRCMPAAADRVALAVALRLYPGLSREVLANRLPYLRLLPRLFGPAEQRTFAATGLVLERNERWPGSSVAKPRHRLMVWRVGSAAEHAAGRS
ncbi:MAG TPA: class I SAM-dependent methyltransferase [Acetobacteraceae bacterium]|nr:class I SAM-dependent methyltransferase [Acetobacteraceae bacterium]